MSYQLPTDYQTFIATSRYSRWRDDLGRRENWEETVDRYFDFFSQRLSKDGKLTEEVQKELAECREAVLKLEVLPSMRALMTAGKALEKSEVAGYNCAYVSVDHPHVFDEIMFILLNGTGVGFSVEAEDVAKLPELPSEFHPTDTVIVVADSKIGWATAYRELVSMLYAGKIPKWDVSKVRPAGARLKTFGGRASGPAPLIGLFNFTVKVFSGAIGRKLKPVECHDIVCKIAEIVVVGGVRRCLPTGTMVLTPNGLKPIESLNPNDSISIRGEAKKVIAKEKSDGTETVKIETQLGEYHSSPSHRWAVISNIDTGEVEWKMAKDLTPDDTLIFDTNGIEGVETTVPSFNYEYPDHSTTCKPINVNALSTEEWAWLIGFLHGNGYVSSTLKEISFAVAIDQPKTVEKIVNMTERLGVNPQVQQPKESDKCFKVRIKSRQLAVYLSLFKLPHEEICVPGFVLSGTKNIRLAYIAGILDSDGSLKTGSRQNRKTFNIACTVYENYALQLRALMASIGFPVRKNELVFKGPSSWKNKYVVRAIGYSFKDKLAQLLLPYSEKVENDYDFEVVPKKEQCSFSVHPKLMKGSHRRKGFQGAYQYSVRCSWETFKTGQEKFVPVSIVSVSAGENKELWDIQVEGEEFVAEGLITHNSALISLSDLGDNEMRHCKSGSWWESNVQRALANNSAVYNSKPDIGQFMEEWLSLYRSGSGERGLFNRYVAKKYVSELPNRDSNHKFGVNPCCVTGDCPILTDEGYIKIADLVGTEVNVWNGEEFTPVTPFHAGVADVYRVSFSDGTYLDCTSNHKFVLTGGEFVEAFRLNAGDKLEKFPMPVVSGFDTPEVDAYSQGFYSGDGNTGLDFSWVYEPKYSCLDRLVGKSGGSGKYGRKIWKHGKMLDKTYVPVNATVGYKLNWLAGLLDADGTVTRDQNGNGLQIVSTDLEFLRNTRLMLTTLGVRAKVVSGSKSGFRSMPDGHGGYKDYPCQTTWRLLIGNTDTCHLVSIGIKFNRLSVHGNPPQRDARQFVKVASVDRVSFDTDVYCFTEPKKHTGTFNGIVTGQSEIILRPAEFCNLSSVQIAPSDTPETLKRKVKIATILGTLQSSLTNFRYLRKIWKKNCEEERLLGVSMSGICDNEMTSDPYSPKLQELLAELREYTREINADWAAKIGINPSVSITCVKPEGTTGQLADRASGIHPRYSQYYIRTVRADKKDPLAIMMKDAGFPVEDDITKPDSTYVFSFPMKSPEGSKMRDDMTAIDQLELWLTYKQYWADHTVSCTIYVREHEWVDVAAWVYKHFDHISGLSFLPHSNHVYKQAPYTECTKEEYEAALAKMPASIDWDALALYEKNDETTGAQELSCVSGSCDLI